LVFLRKLNLTLKALILLILPGVFLVITITYIVTKQTYFFLDQTVKQKTKNLTNAAKPNANLFLLTPEEKVSLNLQLIKGYLILGGAGGFIYVIIVYASLNRFIIRPLQTLKAATKKAAQGRLNIAVKTEQADEIGQLYLSFNEMLATLKEREAENLKLQQLLNQKYEEAKMQAITDALTGLYNHRYFHDRLEAELARARRQKSYLTLAFLDLDDFKNFNDSYGHILGDQALQSLAALIKKVLRASDVAFRYGGEEFAIIFPDTDLAGAKTVAGRLLKEVATFPLKVSENKTVNLTVSIGLAAFPGAATKTELINQADAAMYRAKKKGKNRLELSLQD
jgi:diguanylate cyclase (GGDEF)-like protein